MSFGERFFIFVENMDMRFFVFVLLFISCFVFGQSETKIVKDREGNDVVEKMATFPGGANEFRNLISKNFRIKKVKIKGLAKCDITFVVDRDGTVTDIKAIGENESFNQEAIRAISKIKTKWSPATINGTNVRYRYKVPLKMVFD